MNFFKSLRFCRVFLLVLLSFSNFLFSQQTEAQTQIPPATIVLTSGAEIFSSDENFNRQVLSDKVILKNSDLSYQENSGQENSLTVTSKFPKKESRDLKNQFKIAEERNQKETLKKIKKEIDQHSEKSKSFLNDRFNNFPISEEFIISAHINQNYVVPSYNSYDFSKIHITEDSHSLHISLDFLHSQKFTYYNNRSLDYCFSDIFSVRPPPFYS